MKKVLDAVHKAAAEQATKATHELFGELKTNEKLMVFGLGLIGLSLIATYKEEEKKRKRKHKPGR